MTRRYPAQTLIETRAGFAALLDRIEGNGARTVIVEGPYSCEPRHGSKAIVGMDD